MAKAIQLSGCEVPTTKWKNLLTRRGFHVRRAAAYRLSPSCPINLTDHLGRADIFVFTNP